MVRFFVRFSSRNRGLAISLVRILPLSSSKSVPNSFFTFSSGNQVFATVSCTFCQPHLPTSSSKSVRNASVFKHFQVEIAPSLQSCALFVGSFPRSCCATAETETLLRRPRQPLDLKKHRVLRPRVFSSLNLNSRVPDLLHFSTA